jgi:hypothetical protein
MKELIHQYGAWIVFALVFLESICLPLPGEAILVSAAILTGTTQDLSIALVLLMTAATLTDNRLASPIREPRSSPRGNDQRRWRRRRGRMGDAARELATRCGICRA